MDKNYVTSRSIKASYEQNEIKMEINKIPKSLTNCVLTFYIQLSLKTEKSDTSDVIGQCGGKIEYAERQVPEYFWTTKKRMTNNIFQPIKIWNRECGVQWFTSPDIFKDGSQKKSA